MKSNLIKILAAASLFLSVVPHVAAQGGPPLPSTLGKTQGTGWIMVYIEESVSLDPNQAPSLLALGTLRYEEADYPSAIDVLNKAVQLDPSSWKSQWMLSGSYLHQHDYQQAREHAEKALATGKEAANRVQLILGEALAGLGERQRAIAAFEVFLTDYPNDPSAPKIRGWVENLRKTPQK